MGILRDCGRYAGESARLGSHFPKLRERESLDVHFKGGDFRAPISYQ